MALVMGMAFRFLPLLLEEAHEIAIAQRARGVKFYGRSRRRKLKGLISMVVPLFLSTLRRSHELAQAMEASTAALVAATQAQPLTPESLAAPMQRVEDSCKACHEEFRAF